MKRWPPLASRVLIILGISLAIAGLVAGAYGARTETRYTGALDMGGAQGAALLVFSLSSNGEAVINVTGAREVFYVSNLTGDPLSVLRALSVFNIRLAETDMRHDVRAGLVTGYATINTSQVILEALPRIAGLLDFSIIRANETGSGSYTISAGLKAASGVIVLVVPEDSVVEYSIRYRLVGYDRLEPFEAGVIGGFLVAAGVVYDVMVARRSGVEDSGGG